jgi:hypothetical protein
MYAIEWVGSREMKAPCVQWDALYDEFIYNCTSENVTCWHSNYDVETYFTILRDDSQDGSIVIAMSCGLDSCVRFPAGARVFFFSSPQSPDRLWDPPNFLPIPVVKRPKPEAEYFSHEFKESEKLYFHTHTPPPCTPHKSTWRVN